MDQTQQLVRPDARGSARHPRHPGDPAPSAPCPGAAPRIAVRGLDRRREALPEVRHGQPLDGQSLRQLQGAAAGLIVRTAGGSRRSRRPRVAAGVSGAPGAYPALDACRMHHRHEDWVVSPSATAARPRGARPALDACRMHHRREAGGSTQIPGGPVLCIRVASINPQPSGALTSRAGCPQPAGAARLMHRPPVVMHSSCITTGECSPAAVARSQALDSRLSDDRQPPFGRGSRDPGRQDLADIERGNGLARRRRPRARRRA